MNMNLKKIISGTAIIFTLFAMLGFLGISNAIAQTEECAIVDTEFTATQFADAGTAGFFITTNGHCPEGLKVFMKYKQYSYSDNTSKYISTNLSGIIETSTVFPKEDTTAGFYYKTSNIGCNQNDIEVDGEPDYSKFDCFFYPVIAYQNQSIFDGEIVLPDTITSSDIWENQKKKILAWWCEGSCDGNDLWGVMQTLGADSSNCKIENNDVSFTSFDHGGTSITNKLIKLRVKSADCYDGFLIKPFYYHNGSGVEGYAFDFLTGGLITTAGIHVFKINNYPDDFHFIPPTNEDLELIFHTTEDTCYENGNSNISPTENADCRIGLVIGTLDGEILFDSTNFLTGNNTLVQNKPGLVNFADGVIFAECDDEGDDGTTDCDSFNKKWKLTDSNAVNVEIGPQFVANNVVYNSSNPCYVAAHKDANGKNIPEGYDPKCYEFLAPIPGIELDANGVLDPNFISQIDSQTGEARIAIRDITQYQLGSFINKLFQIAVAILGVMAVVMIVVAGIEYMTTEAIYNKGAAKQKITSAATGLILALGIFIILNTINPQLLEINFGSNLKQVKLEILDGNGLSNSEAIAFANAPPVAAGFYTLPSNGPISSCSGERIIEGVSQTHGALDIKLVSGSPIFAAADGKVSRTHDSCPNKRVDSCGNGFGNKIYITHSNGEESIYAHLSEVLVDKNDTVKKGDKIGLSGNSGHSLGPHLHFQVQDKSTKQKRNLDGMTPECS